MYLTWLEFDQPRKMSMLLLIVELNKVVLFDVFKI